MEMASSERRWLPDRVLFFDLKSTIKEVVRVTLEEMKNVDVRTVSRDELVDIRDVHIDPDLPKEERILQFVKQIKNPYCFKVGNVVVKSCFADTDITLDDRLEHYLRNK